MQVTLELSTDGGQRWQTLAEDLPAEGTWMWDTSSVPEGSRVLLRARAADARGNGLDTRWEPITISGNPQSPRLPLYVR